MRRERGGGLTACPVQKKAKPETQAESADPPRPATEPSKGIDSKAPIVVQSRFERQSCEEGREGGEERVGSEESGCGRKRRADSQ